MEAERHPYPKEEEEDVFTTDLRHVEAGRQYSRLDSYSSVSSMYSADGGQGNYKIAGRVQLGVKHRNDVLLVNVVRAEGLAGAKSGGVSDPYVKTYLLPDRSKLTKRKTGIHRKTTSPEYNHTLKNKLLKSEKDQKTLWVSVWDWDKYGRNQFLGGFKLPLKDITDSTERWYNLEEKNEQGRENFRAKMKVAIKFTPQSDDTKRGSLSVLIKEAFELPEMNSHGCTDATVKVYLLPKRNSSYAKKKTGIVMGSQNHIWNEEFQYKLVSFEDLKTNRVLEMTVWDYDQKGCNDFIGCLRLGPNPSGGKEWMDSLEEEVKPWEEMLDHPGEWVECCLNLRPSIQNLLISSRKGSDGDRADLLSRTATLDQESDEESNYGSKTSLYSDGCTRGDYDITGEVRISLSYEGGKLCIEIHDAKGLATADGDVLPDSYATIYLLPDKGKHSKMKTNIKNKTLDPVFNEKFWYEVDKMKLTSRTLWLTMWDRDKLEKNKFLGEVSLHLSDINFNAPSTGWYPLQDEDASFKVFPSNFDRGKLRLGLMFKPLEDKKGKIKGALHIHVEKAMSLPNMDEVGLSDGFVKLYLLPDKRFRKRKKTAVIKNNLDPVWNEEFVYENVTLDELSNERVLEVTVWDRDLISSNDFIGGLRLGPSPHEAGKYEEWMDSSSEESRHWEEMLTHKGKWVECWHSLRESMDPNDSISFSDYPDGDKITFRHRISNVISKSERPLQKQNEEGISVENENVARFNRKISLHSVIEKISVNDPYTCRVTEQDKIYFQKCEISDSSPSHDKSKSSQKRHTRSYSEPESELSKIVQKEINSRPMAKHIDLALSFTDLRMRDGTQGDHVHIFKNRRELLGTDLLDSGDFGSTTGTEIYDEEFDVKGEVLFGFFFKGNQLLVNIERARNLATSSNINGEALPNPYIETHLLPNTGKHSKKRTDVKRNTCYPVYNHQVQYKLSHHELNSYTLWLSVWDWNKTGDKFLGEIRFPLSSVDLTDSKTNWHRLHDKVHGNEGGYKGEISIAMKYEIFNRKKGKSRGQLCISFKRARSLSSSNPHVNSIVKCCLLPDRFAIGRRKTSVIKDNCNPVWDEILTYERLNLDELASERVLEVVIWDYKGHGLNNEFIGGLRLGPSPKIGVKHKVWMDSIGEEASHWESVMSRPGEWIEVWHTLRTTMDYRNI